jgi:hypothetical protein
MADADLAVQGLLFDQVFQTRQLAHGTTQFQDAPLVDASQSGRVIAPVLELTQAAQQDAGRVALADESNNAAHAWSLENAVRIVKEPDKDTVPGTQSASAWLSPSSKPESVGADGQTMALTVKKRRHDNPSIEKIFVCRLDLGLQVPSISRLRTNLFAGQSSLYREKLFWLKGYGRLG